jgi:hypothetical protein
MLVSKKKHDLLIKNYNELVDDRDTWQGRCINHVNYKPVAFEIVDEEQEVTKYKYAKITKHSGLCTTDKEVGLEIGKSYKIVEYKNTLSDDCYVHVSDKYPHYFISETQYELVEKEEVPELKVNVNVDVKEVIQAKIEQLRTDAEIISNKRNRMEWQMFNLNSKANKLEEVIETIKEFE